MIEIERRALNLPEKQRAILAATLLASLNGAFADEGDGITEALRRDADIEANPSQVISLAELDEQIEAGRLQRPS